MNSNLPPVVLILCMHRSGSSLAAQLISKTGIYMGESLYNGNHFNPDGYFEYKPLVEFHEKMLAHTCMTWYLPFAEVPVDNLLETFSEEAANLIAAMDRPGIPWCWKDPRLALFLPFWQRLFQGRQVISIVTSRNPAAIASSLLHRSQLPEFHSLALWEYTMLQILRFVQTIPGPTHTISYEQLTEHSEATSNTLVDFLQSNVNVNVQYFDSDDISQIVKPALNRQNIAESAVLSERQATLLDYVSEQRLSLSEQQITSQLTWLRSYFSLFKDDPTQVRKEIESRLYWKEKEPDTFSTKQYLSCRLEEKRISFSSPNKLNIRFLRLQPANVACTLKLGHVYINGRLNEPVSCHVTDSNARFSDKVRAYFTGTHNWMELDLGHHYKDVTSIEFNFTELNTGMEAAKILLAKNDLDCRKTEQKYEQLLYRTGEIKWLIRRLVQQLKHRINLL